MDHTNQSGREPRFEVVATIGPASVDLARELVSAGADSLRINASHVLPGTLGFSMKRIREQAADVPIVVDLQGAKMRLGILEERRIRVGEILVLALASSGTSAANEIPLPHPEIFRSAVVGETLTIDDGRIRLRVESTSADHLQARALVDGTLLQRKGVNIVEHPVELDDLSESDRGFLEESRDTSSVSFAFSFMRDGREAGWIRERLPGAKVAAKIERAEAVDALETIAGRTDAIWICRGDLREQLGDAGLGLFVGTLDPRVLGRRVLMAGQVLEHLTRHALPTRSEICHLYDIVKRGYAGIVLSDETAIGDDPVNAVRQARKMIDSFSARPPVG